MIQKKYAVAFKSDKASRIGYMSASDYNLLQKQEINLDKNDFIAVAGNRGIPPITKIADENLNHLNLAYTNEQNLLTTGFQYTYFIVSDTIYSSMDYPVYKTYLFELEHWTHHIDLAHKITKSLPTIIDKRYVASKITLYDSEMFVKSVMFFIGFMLSLIFLSAAMSILYFYLQTTLIQEKEKYIGIRKLGLSKKELSTVVSKELAILIFVPFSIATVMLFTTLFTMRTMISIAFLQVSMVSSLCFFALFLVSYLFIRNSYIKRLLV